MGVGVYLKATPMTNVTRILSGIEEGAAADQCLLLVYDELGRLAAQEMAREKPGQTLQATGLVYWPRFPRNHLRLTRHGGGGRVLPGFAAGSTGRL